MRAAVLLLLAAALPAAAFDHSHAALDRLLKAHVKPGGLVDYVALKAERKALDAYCESLGAASPGGWSREQQFAFWLNAYNAFTLKAVADNYPIQGSWLSLYPKNSIRQIRGVWDKLKFQAGGRSVTLDQIEHQILRQDFGDPRLHAAIVCASMSCPQLRPEPYVVERLDLQLTDAARRFAAARNRIDVAKKQIEASQIFEWFPKDFLKVYAPDGKFAGLSGKQAAAASFLAEFAPAAEAKAIAGGGFAVRFAPYDWSLNDAR